MYLSASLTRVQSRGLALSHSACTRAMERLGSKLLLKTIVFARYPRIISGCYRILLMCYGNLLGSDLALAALVFKHRASCGRMKLSLSVCVHARTQPFYLKTTSSTCRLWRCL